MNKELEEAMEIIDAYVCASSSQGEFHKSFEIIKSALERKEKLEKAWEITKTKRVALCKIVNSKDYLEYNQFVYELVNEYAYELLKLTEDEFNLLKKMLEESK